MNTKGQSRGHCQKCGAIQVVLPDAMLAKHGYTVPNGYFQGTCQGSHELPLEASRVITDAIIKACNETADGAERLAGLWRDGSLMVHMHNVRSGKLDRHGFHGYHEVMMFGCADYTLAAERRNSTEREESQARFFRSHAKSMTELAAAVHGQPLINRDEEELAKVAVRAAKKAPIEGVYRTKIEQKRALEVLNNQYSKLARIIKDRYLAEPARSHGDAGEAMYYEIPFDLHCWRDKHDALVLAVYPQMRDIVNQIRGLVVARIEIKSRPVIK